MEISGVIQSGPGKGVYFTQVDWVVKQCENKLDMTPFPGTLNVRIDDRTVHDLGDFLRMIKEYMTPWRHTGKFHLTKF